MNTHIHSAWKAVKQPILVGLASIMVGSALGHFFPPDAAHQYSCMQSQLKAHFLERRIAFESSTLYEAAQPAVKEVTPEPLRPAAPINEASSSSSEASVASESSSSEALAPVESSISSESSSSSSQPAAVDTFPAFGSATYPVGRIPNWGAMKSKVEWERTYDEMDRTEFVRMPAYDMQELVIPLKELRETRNDPQTIRILTAKLFYSTRYFGSYNLDSGEFTGDHAGVDLKVPEGTPIASIAGGRIHAVLNEATGLGMHVMIEHRIGDETYYSIYGHLSSTSVIAGNDIEAGDIIGRSGSTGNSTGPHLHLQIDRGEAGEALHKVYWPSVTPSAAAAAEYTVHPMWFIREHSL